MVEKASKVWMDGALVDWEEATLPLLTHTFHYGLGAFEGIRCYQRADGRSQIFRLRDHIRRLFESSKICTLTVPFTEEEICQACRDLLRVNGQAEAYLRPVVYVGEGRMGLAAIDNPTRVAIVSWKWGTYLGDGALERGIRAKVSSFTRNHPNAVMAKGKINGHYVNSILAKREAVTAGESECFLAGVIM